MTKQEVINIKVMKTDDNCQECKKDWTKCCRCQVMMKRVKEHKKEQIDAEGLDKRGKRMTNQDAIKILFKHREHWNRLLKDGICEEKEGKDIVKAIDTAVVALDYHPIGRWIEDGEGFLYPYKCSNCGSVHDKLFNFCPSCGERKDLLEWVVDE